MFRSLGEPFTTFSPKLGEEIPLVRDLHFRSNVFPGVWDTQRYPTGINSTPKEIPTASHACRCFPKDPESTPVFGDPADPRKFQIIQVTFVKEKRNDFFHTTTKLLYNWEVRWHHFLGTSQITYCMCTYTYTVSVRLLP